MSDKKHDYQYLEMMEYILKYGTEKLDRTGTGTISIFDYQMKFDLSDGSIPLLTTKKMFTKGIIHELLWFLRGSTDVRELQAVGVHIWDKWMREDGTIGKGYGRQWRHWETGKKIWTSSSEYEYQVIDQISKLIDGLKNDPDGRRHIVNAWNVGELDDMELPPCHLLFQCYVANGTLSMKMYQRSCDVFLGVPFNIAQYSILLHMLAQVCNLKPGIFIWDGGDVHIYSNHIEQCKTQLKNLPYKSPTLLLNPSIDDIFEFRFDDFAVKEYLSYPSITAEASA